MINIDLIYNIIKQHKKTVGMMFRPDEETQSELISSYIQTILNDSFDDLMKLNIDDPTIVTLLINVPDSVIREAVNMQKLDYYIKLHRQAFHYNPDMLRELFLLYRKVILFNPQWTNEALEFMSNHILEFVGIMQNFLCKVNSLSEEYIMLLLAANKAGFRLYPNFPSYVLVFGELSFSILCQCIIEFIYRPQNYSFQQIGQQFCQTVITSLDQFVKKIKQKDQEDIKLMKNLIINMLGILLDNLGLYQGKNKNNQFKEVVLNKLMKNQDFVFLMSSMMMRKSNFEFLFSRWVECLIRIGQKKLAMKVVEYTLVQVVGTVDKLNIFELIDRNREWMAQWTDQLFKKNRVEEISALFLKSDPFYLMFFNELLANYSRIYNPEQFLDMLRLIGYEEIARKTKYTPQSKQSMFALFSIFFNDYEDLVNDITEDSDRRVI